MRLNTDTISTLIAQIEAHIPFEENEARHQAAILEFLRWQAEPFSRSTLVGHITGSAVLVDAEGQHVGLIWHEKLLRWLQPGGHCEPQDESVLAGARRELMEETDLPLDAVSVAQETPFDLDVHEIPARGAEPTHFHYDVRYLFQTPYSRLLQREGIVQWRPIEEIATSPDISQARYAQKLLKRGRLSET
jgi:8-oxo-dGTP pyrophosphatase MutT (NUDIX family)